MTTTSVPKVHESDNGIVNQMIQDCTDFLNLPGGILPEGEIVALPICRDKQGGATHTRTGDFLLVKVEPFAEPLPGRMSTWVIRVDGEFRDEVLWLRPPIDGLPAQLTALPEDNSPTYAVAPDQVIGRVLYAMHKCA